MPQLIPFIDAIARANGRDALCIIFLLDDTIEKDWEILPVRKQIIQWLDANSIDWQPCGRMASTDCIGPYSGEIYVDVPFDEHHPVYKVLRDYLERPDGTMVFERAVVCYCPLSAAMKNAHHDEPGFWENWANDF